MIDKKILEEYAELKTLMKEMESRMKELQPEILGFMEGEGVEELESEFGNFSLQGRRKWTYPTSIIEAEEKVKKAKKEAEQVGDATYVVNNSLYFTAKK